MRLVAGEAVGVASRPRAAISPASLPVAVSNRATRVAEDVGDPERLAVVRERQARRDAAGRLPLRPARDRSSFDLVREQAVGVVEARRSRRRTRRRRRAACRRPTRPGRRRSRGSATRPMTLPVGGVDGDDLVLAVAGVEDGQDRLGSGARRSARGSRRAASACPAGLSDQPLGSRTVPARVMPGQVGFSARGGSSAKAGPPARAGTRAAPIIQIHVCDFMRMSPSSRSMDGVPRPRGVSADQPNDRTPHGPPRASNFAKPSRAR